MSPKKWSFASRLEEILREKGVTQYALAKRTGITKQAISRLVLGHHEPTWDTVQRIAKALDMDCRDFVDPALTIPADQQAEQAAPPDAGEEEAEEEKPAKKPAGRKGKGKK